MTNEFKLFDVQKGFVFKLIYKKSNTYRSIFSQEGEQKS